MTTNPVRTFQCKPFPDVELSDESGYWSGTLTLGEATLPMSLYVGADVSDASLRAASTLLSDLLTLRDRGRAAIAEEATRDETIMRDFFLFHVEEVPECLPETVRLQATNEAFVGALKLVGVAIHPDDETLFHVVLDFSFGRNFSDEVLAVTFHPDGSIRQVSHES